MWQDQDRGGGTHLQHIGDDVSLALLQEALLVKGGVHTQDLREHLRHLRLREQAPWGQPSQESVGSPEPLPAASPGVGVGVGGGPGATHSPSRSVTLSVSAREARMSALSLSSYFIFISKNPAGDRGRGRCPFWKEP